MQHLLVVYFVAVYEAHFIGERRFKRNTALFRF